MFCWAIFRIEIALLRRGWPDCTRLVKLLKKQLTLTPTVKRWARYFGGLKRCWQLERRETIFSKHQDSPMRVLHMERVWIMIPSTQFCYVTEPHVRPSLVISRKRWRTAPPHSMFVPLMAKPGLEELIAMSR